MSPSPRNWPSQVVYSSSYIYHSSVDPETKAAIHGNGRTPPSLNHHAVFIKKIEDENHPACGQYGLFASKKIHPKSLILYYMGEVHGDDRQQSDYDLSLYRSQDGSNIGIDATNIGNEARFINDYRGVTTKPNAIFTEERKDGGELRICIMSGSEVIKKSEEIVVSYGKAWWRARTGEAV